MSKKLEPGATFAVQVGGVKYPGVADAHGVHRFVENQVIGMITTDGGPVDLNTLSLLIRKKKPELRHVAEFWMMLGYSLSGFGDLSMFEHLEIVAPTWWREGLNYDGTLGKKTLQERAKKPGKKGNLKLEDLKRGQLVIDSWWPEKGAGTVQEVMKTRVKILFPPGALTPDCLVTYDQEHVQFLEKVR